ncbi:unnamed protein product [Parnassius mnemosyne]|uniref:Uncharacterized protein n=1 Tax=Parnassius mnemosyne TaxID=213953 RepID=A0AAV1KA94_9NEOP
MFCSDTDNEYPYAARYGAEGGSASASEGAPLPAHSLTGALIPAKTLSRRHFVHKVSANGAEELTEDAAARLQRTPRRRVTYSSEHRSPCSYSCWAFHVNIYYVF